VCVRRRSGTAGRGGCNSVFGGRSRRIWLTVLAVSNLVLWLGVAAGVGLLASDKMNLGLEGYLRERQATAMARLNQPPGAQAGVAPGSAGSFGAIPSGGEAQGAESPLTPSPAELASLGTPTPVTEGQGTAGQSSGELASSPLMLSDPEFSSLGQVSAEMSRSTIGRRVQIRYDEAILNREITTVLAQSSDLGFRDVQVNLDPGKVIVTGDVTVLGFDVGAEVEGVVLVENCLPRVELQTVSVEGFLTPGFVKDEVAKMVLGALDFYPADSALCLERIDLEDGVVTVYGYRR
jgi:hypothetical protein